VRLVLIKYHLVDALLTLSWTVFEGRRSSYSPGVGTGVISDAVGVLVIVVDLVEVGEAVEVEVRVLSGVVDPDMVIEAVLVLLMVDDGVLVVDGVEVLVVVPEIVLVPLLV
jgi:hypothetical protein